jgi:hypothetical protein
MATSLFTLTSLKELFLLFKSPQSHPDPEGRHPPLLTRSILPVLTHFVFKGVCEYLEDLVARIDAPRLVVLKITFLNLIVLDTPQFIQFISRTPALKEFEKVQVIFMDGPACVNLSSQTSGSGKLTVKISCLDLGWQVSSMKQICTSCLPPLPTLEDLYISQHPLLHPHWQDNIENALWLDLLRPFTGVKNLYLSNSFASRIMPALQELIGGRTTEVLPTLQNLFLEELEQSGTVQTSIQQFVATRQVTSHPIAVFRWDNWSEDTINDASPSY